LKALVANIAQEEKTLVMTNALALKTLVTSITQEEKTVLVIIAQSLRPG
jgi:hypothetical protein